MRVGRVLASLIDTLDIFNLMDPGIPLDELPSWYATGTRLMFAGYALYGLIAAITGVRWLMKML